MKNGYYLTDYMFRGGYMKKKIVFAFLFTSFLFCLSAKSEKVYSKIEYDCIRTEIDISEYLDNKEVSRKDRKISTASSYDPKAKYDNSTTFGKVQTGVNTAVGVAALTSAVVSLIDNSIDYKYYEMDVDAEVKYKKEKYNLKKCIAVSAKSEVDAKKFIKEEVVPEVFAVLYELPDEEIKEIKVTSMKCTEENRTKNKDYLRRNDIFVNDISDEDNIVYEFVGDITYQKNKTKKDFEKKIYEDAEVTFRSSLSTLGIAVFDFQIELWEYARENGFKDAPYPEVRNIKAYKLEYVPKGNSKAKNLKDSKKNSKKAKNNEEEDSDNDIEPPKKKNSSDKKTKKSNNKSDDLQVLIDMYKKGLLDEDEFLEAKERLSE